MGTNVESRLSEMLPAQLGELSILERKVSTYLLKHEDKLMGMDISEIAKASGVSKATVVRFCKALGFKGLKDFKIYYEAGKSQYSTKLSKLGKGVSAGEVMESMKSGIIRTIEKSSTEENLSAIVGIAEDLSSLKRATILYTEESVHPYMLSKRLKRLGYECAIYSTKNAIDEDVAEGVIFVITSDGDIDGIGPYVRRAREKGCRFATITSNPKSWIAANSDNTISVFNEKILSEDKCLLCNFAIAELLETLYILLVSQK